MSTASFNDLPEDVLYVIIILMPDAITLCRLACVNRNLTRLVKENEPCLWERFYRLKWKFMPGPLNDINSAWIRAKQDKYPNLKEKLYNAEISNYRDLYKERYEVDNEILQTIVEAKKSRNYILWERLRLDGWKAYDVAFAVATGRCDNVLSEKLNTTTVNVETAVAIAKLQAGNLLVDINSAVAIRELSICLCMAYVERRRGVATIGTKYLESMALLLSRCEMKPRDLLTCPNAAAEIESNARQQLEDLAQAVKERLNIEGISSENTEAALNVLNQYLFQEVGFHGNSDDYYNIANTSLLRALETKTANPITLATLYVCVCHRVGIEANMIGLPGHFIVGISPVLFVDVFAGGNLLSIEDCQQIVQLYRYSWDERFLRPLSPMEVLQRMINNVRMINDFMHNAGDRPIGRHIFNALEEISVSIFARDSTALITDGSEPDFIIHEARI